MEDKTNFVIVRPCGYCSSSFYCYDIVVTSYKYNFHHSCLGAMLIDVQNCCVCNATLHPE
jgi:hypothetical protein